MRGSGAQLKWRTAAAAERPRCTRCESDWSQAGRCSDCAWEGALSTVVLLSSWITRRRRPDSG
jgi:hypothetical protein